MKHLISLILLLATAFALAAEPVKHVQAAEAAKLISDGKITVLDVRTADEFGEGHIKGAKNIDIFADDFAAQLGKLDKTKPVLVHCQSGGRSTRSLETFEQLGFKDVTHLDGGFAGWSKAGLPVEK
ncbi:MAG: rhodanese-like domain-containing protein [Verrucomicrobiaceae bacterium]|nr:rhodanese-like domain-containing protein [Verrucomicrobiaceae bacterium]